MEESVNTKPKENNETQVASLQGTTESQLQPNGVSSIPLSVDHNLIDLNTPNTPLKGSASGMSTGDIADTTVDGLLSSSPGHDFLYGNMDKNGQNTQDLTKVHKSVSSYSNSVENGLESNSLYVSHTESGYLTDSVTSHVSRDRHPSVSGSEADKTPNHETRPSSSSENDITPCTEKLFALSDSLARLSTNTNSGGTKTNHGQTRKAKSERLLDFDDMLQETCLESLTHINSDCDNTGEVSNGDVKRYSSSSRPESLLLAKSTQDQENGNIKGQSDVLGGKLYGQTSHAEKYENRKRSKSSGFPIPRLKEGVDIGEEGLSKSLPHGQILKSTTGMIEYVADDLMEKIRRSSPMSKTASSDVSSSRRSSQLSLTSLDSFNSSTMATSMTSGMSMSYPQSPDCIPPIDPMAVHEIEIQARIVADGLDLMMGNLRTNLHKMSAITVGCEEAYRTSVAVTCDSVDSSIKSMYALMAKCEELSQTMKPVYKLADQIKEIKRLLDRFEHQLADKP